MKLETRLNLLALASAAATEALQLLAFHAPSWAGLLTFIVVYYGIMGVRR